VLGKVTEKNRLLGSSVQTVTGGINDNFQMENRGKVSDCGRRDNNCLFRNIGILMEDEGQDNKLR
jgi:hypothetical protein